MAEDVFRTLGLILAVALGSDEAARTKLRELIAEAGGPTKDEPDFGNLGQILAETYAAKGKDITPANNAKVVRELGGLIDKANQASYPGICTVPLTNPPTKIKMTKAQCAAIPGGTWQPTA